MLCIHLIVNYRFVQGTRPAKHFLLGSGATKESSTRLNPVREVQRNRL
jgi:hypothetical protein